MTKISSVEERVKEFNKVFPLPRILVLSGGMGVQRDMMNNWLTQALTADRLALLTELREWAISKLEETYVEEDGVPVDTYGYPETHNQPLLELQTHLDELIKSNSI